MQVRFTRSARKHRIGKGRALAAMNNAGEPQRIPPPAEGLSEMLLWVGEDDRGLALEVLALERPDCLLVIHVMPYAWRE